MSITKLNALDIVGDLPVITMLPMTSLSSFVIKFIQQIIPLLLFDPGPPRFPIAAEQITIGYW